MAESFEANAALTEQALAETAGLPAGLRLRRVLAVTREWAVMHPTQYGIIQGVLRDPQIENADLLVAPERRPFHAICSLVAELRAPEPLADAMALVLRDSSPPGSGEARWGGYSGEVLLHALTIWSRLHGVISLEINGVLDRMGMNATAFFDAEVDQLLSGDPPAPSQGAT